MDQPRCESHNAPCWWSLHPLKAWNFCKCHQMKFQCKKIYFKDANAVTFFFHSITLWWYICTFASSIIVPAASWSIAMKNVEVYSIRGTWKRVERTGREWHLYQCKNNVSNGHRQVVLSIVISFDDNNNNNNSTINCIFCVEPCYLLHLLCDVERASSHSFRSKTYNNVNMEANNICIAHALGSSNSCTAFV